MLKELKKQVCQANRDLARYGLVTLTWGNVSGIHREKGLVVIKPSGIPYADLVPEQLVVIDLNGKVVEGQFRPSSDTPTHLILYQSFPEIGGITHTHSPHATMFAQTCRGIPCLGTTHADHFYGEVPITRPLTKVEVASNYEENTGKVIVERFADLNRMEMPAVLVANHGPFTWGKDAADSLKNSVALEEVARIAFGTFTLTGKWPTIPQYLLDKHYQRKHGSKTYYGQKKTSQETKS